MNTLQLANQLIEEGKKTFKPDALMSGGQYIGAALAKVSDNSKFFLDIAYEGLEFHNYKECCSLMDWAFQELDRTHFYEDDLIFLKKLVEKENVEIVAECHYGGAVKKSRRVKVEVVITELE